MRDLDNENGLEPKDYTAALKLMQSAYNSLCQAYEDMCDRGELFDGPHMYWNDKIDDILDKMMYLQVLGNRRKY